MYITLKEVQILELEIAKEIKRVCEVLGIPYFITDGTLLGAVRHRGFIPWDDDFDIGMTAVHYKRFLSLAPKILDDRFVLQTDANDENYAYAFAKVRLKHTHFREVITDGLLRNDGIFVDIFPYDPASYAMTRGLHMRKLQLLCKIKMLKAGYRLNCLAQGSAKKGINSILKHVPLSRRKIDAWIASEILRGSQNGAAYYIERDGNFRGNYVFPAPLLENFTELEFEDTSFSAPKDYECFLRTVYGNYWELPPESERSNVHSASCFEVNIPFEALNL